MKIYTRTGDEGQTGLFGGGRVAKTHPRVEAYGAVDELNAGLGAARAAGLDADIDARLLALQGDLLAIGAHLATPTPAHGKRPDSLPPLPQERVAEMERWIDEAETELPPLRHFVLPGGTAAAAALHLARTVCRRAERRVIELRDGHGDVDAAIVVHLNRLSDLLFVLARLANRHADVDDVAWIPTPRG